MLKRCFSLISLVFFLSSCVSFPVPVPIKLPFQQAVQDMFEYSVEHRTKKPPPLNVPAGKKTQIKKIKSFNRIEVQGRIKVRVHTGYKKPQIILHGDARDLAVLSVRVVSDTLHIRTSDEYPQVGPISVDIRGQFLNQVRAKDVTQITGSQLYTSVLDLYLENTGKVILEGKIGLHVLDVASNDVIHIKGVNSRDLKLNLRGNPKVRLSGAASLTRLNIDGNTHFNLSGIKTNNLMIRAKQSPTIQLSGQVNRLDVVLWDNARFKGRYLRAERSFVKTHDHAIAEISTAKHQSTLATDGSDIYYYKLSDTRAEFMAQEGSVLDMREWHERAVHDYDRYNKQFP